MMEWRARERERECWGFFLCSTVACCFSFSLSFLSWSSLMICVWLISCIKNDGTQSMLHCWSFKWTHRTKKIRKKREVEKEIAVFRLHNFNVSLFLSFHAYTNCIHIISSYFFVLFRIVFVIDVILLFASQWILLSIVCAFFLLSFCVQTLMIMIFHTCYMLHHVSGFII